METPQVEGTIQEIINRLIEPRLSLLNAEFSRACEAILKELASVRTPLDELLHQGLGEEIVQEISFVIAEHDRQQEEKARRQLAEAVTANDKAWEGKLAAALTRAEESFRLAAAEEIATRDSQWEERLASTRSEIEAAGLRKIDYALAHRDTEWQAKLAEAVAARDAEWQSRLAASEVEIRQAMERQQAETLSTAQEAWRLKADQAEASQRESWRERLAEATARAEDSWRDRLTAVVTLGREVLASANQTEIMAHMVDAASHFAGRVVLFIAKGDFLVAWKTGGSAWKPAPPAASSISISTASATVVSAAKVGLSAQNEEPGDHVENGMLLDILGGERPERIVAVPVVVAGKVPAVLYADHRPTDAIPMDEETILHLVSMVQHRIEMIGLLRRGRTGEAGTGESAPVPQTAPPAPAPSKETETPAVEPHHPAAPPPRPRPVPESPPAEPKAPASSDAQIASAQRLARVLITEIKLYNEKAVAEARVSRNIYLSLKREIDISLEHYKSKVSKETASHGDFFHEEIIRTLCQGDSSLLGKDYPGPVSTQGACMASSSE